MRPPRTNYPPASIKRRLSTIIVIAIALLTLNSADAETAKPELHVFLVDVSGSMLAKAPGSKRSRIKVREDYLKEWFSAHRNSLTTLISFNTEVRSKSICDLRAAQGQDDAAKWVTKQLVIKERFATHLWKSLDEALRSASDLARQNPGEPVVLHVLTDGNDTQRGRRTTREEVFKHFSNAQETEKETDPQRLGDFLISLSDPITPPPPPSPSPPSPTPSPTPTPSSTVTTVVPTPTPTPQPPGPTLPRSPSAESVTIEIQEPTIISSGQYVHFVSKALPNADSYTWTIRRNRATAKGCDLGQDATPLKEIQFSSEDLVYQFKNCGTDEESYNVWLVATYSQKRIVTTPIAFLVRSPPGFWQTLFTSMGALFGTVFGALGGVSGVVAAIKAVKDLIELKNKPSAKESGEIMKSFGIHLGVAILLFLLAVCFVAVARTSWRHSAEKEKVSVEKHPVEVAMSLQKPVSRGAGPLAQSAPSEYSGTPAPATSSAPSERSAERAPAPSRTFYVLTTIIALFASIFLMLLFWHREENGPLRNIFGRSLIEQLDEIERLAQARIIPKNQMREFKAALLRQARRHYKLSPEVAPGKTRPPIPKRPPESKPGV